ncbi:MAG: amidophosphoribosyltransferase [Bdellovibrionales bacterium]|nr:amidophosphoribosyltransferase [Bdellovibrionales bacterium]
MKDLGERLSHGFREECAVFGIWNHPEASRLTYLGLYALQHRGQEASGIVSLFEDLHIVHKGHGLVADVFREETLNSLKGRSAIGHNRYSTTGENEKFNIQPLKASLFNGPIAVAHNGNIVNSLGLRKDLQRKGAIFQGTNDTELILHLVSRNPSDDLMTCLKEELPKLDGAYSMVMLSKNSMIAARDPNGFRPLVLGEILVKGGKAKVVSSETCAFDLIGAKYIREIEPGEIYYCDDEGEQSFFLDNRSDKKNQCIFEHVYFSRPDSIVFGQSVYETRKRLGASLAKECPVEADVVIPVPDSGVPAALGYSQESGIPFELGIIRNHYVGRTFIEPKQSIRSFGVKIKLNPQEAVLKGKRVVVIDDSLVRGTTSKKIINLVRAFGAKEVHMRIAAPPTVSPCYYGVDTPDKEELIAANHSVDEICKYIEADSLGYVSLEGLHRAAEDKEKSEYCAACFTDLYPTEIPKN